MFKMYLKWIFSPVHPKPVQYALRLEGRMKPSPAHLISFFLPTKNSYIQFNFLFLHCPAKSHRVLSQFVPAVSFYTDGFYVIN